MTPEKPSLPTAGSSKTELRRGRISRLPASDSGAVISAVEQDFLFAESGDTAVAKEKTAAPASETSSP